MEKLNKAHIRMKLTKAYSDYNISIHHNIS